MSVHSRSYTPPSHSSIHPSIYQFIHMSIYPPTLPSVNPFDQSIHPSICILLIHSVYPIIYPHIDLNLFLNPSLHPYIQSITLSTHLLVSHSFMHLSIHPLTSLNPYLNPSSHPAIQPSIHPSIPLSTLYPYIHSPSSVHPFIHTPVHSPSIHQQSTYPSVLPPIHPFNKPCTHLKLFINHSPICPSICQPINPSVGLSIHHNKFHLFFSINHKIKCITLSLLYIYVLLLQKSRLTISCKMCTLITLNITQISNTVEKSGLTSFNCATSVFHRLSLKYLI